ncbi:MAG: AAA family ATPase [Rubrivivax sp.]|nr:AAA family ATPase [Rubrivivax sp.]
MTNAVPAHTDAAAAGLVESLRRQLGARLVETHISWVLLDGVHAWKIKKPVRLSFLDFRALATRERLCFEELRLNRRLAPSLYLDVVAIHGTPDAPRLGGGGPVIEYALRMRQFAAGALLSEQLAAGTLLPAHLDRLAQRLADFHAAAAVATPDTPYGRPDVIEGDALRLLDGLSQHGEGPACARLRAWMAAAIPRLHPLWQGRRAAGRVRECHGDLHLANAVLLGDDVTAFDCLEFDPAMRWIDVLSDIGFLVMDLLAHERGDLAFRFLNAYLDASGDHAGVPALRWYLVYRALVRALVTRIRAGQGGAASGPDHLALALRLAAEGDARLLITHGVSGSGKSHVGQRLLEQAQAIRLRSDVERKRLFGLQALDASAQRVPGGIYGADATRRTYARLRELAAIALAAGHRVIVDAAFLRGTERDDFRRLALELGVPFTVLHCQAPAAVLRERVQARGERGDDASEADLAVLERQLAAAEPLSAAERTSAVTVDTAAPLDVDALAARWLAAPGGHVHRRGPD